jgi:hypothetical protein
MNWESFANFIDWKQIKKVHRPIKAGNSLFCNTHNRPNRPCTMKVDDDDEDDDETL